MCVNILTWALSSSTRRLLWLGSTRAITAILASAAACSGPCSPSNSTPVRIGKGVRGCSMSDRDIWGAVQDGARSTMCNLLLLQALFRCCASMVADGHQGDCCRCFHPNDFAILVPACEAHACQGVPKDAAAAAVGQAGAAGRMRHRVQNANRPADGLRCSPAATPRPCLIPLPRLLPYLRHLMKSYTAFPL